LVRKRKNVSRFWKAREITAKLADLRRFCGDYKLTMEGVRFAVFISAGSGGSTRFDFNNYDWT